MKNIPIQDKAYLTLEEAAAYCNIGMNKLREISNEPDCPFVLWNGNKRPFKKDLLIKFLDQSYSI